MNSVAESHENAFWTFSLAVYAAEGVAAECLELQEKYSLDVNVLLFCAWIAWVRQVALTGSDMQAIQADVQPWHEATVKPLRSVRRYMKGMPDGEIKLLRSKVKGLELEAERIEQSMLFALAETRWGARGNASAAVALTSNLALFLRAQGCAEPIGQDGVARHLIAAVVALDAAAAGA